MTCNVLTTFSEVSAFLASVQHAADANRSSLGFLPGSVYQESARQGKLWVGCSPDGSYLGHLLFGGSYPQLKVVQIFVDPLFRGTGIGSLLIQRLAAYGEIYQYISISARVAADLAANTFWEKLGFQNVRQVAGGRTSNRIINIRVRLLNVPLLFTPSDTKLPVSHIVPDLGNSPVLTSPTYALDIDSFTGLLQQRQLHDPLGAIVQSANSNLINLVLTPGSQSVLGAAELSLDPVAKFIHQLPELPELGGSTHAALLIETIRAISPLRRNTTRARSAPPHDTELTRLAACIGNRISGIITSDRYILRAAEEIRRQFGFEIISPYEFLEPEFDSSPQTLTLTAQAGSENIEVCEFRDTQTENVKAFLMKRGLSDNECEEALKPMAGSRRRMRLCVFSGERLLGFSSWDSSNRMKRHIHLYLYVDESSPQGERAIEHLLEAVSRRVKVHTVVGVHLHHGQDQPLTRSVALSRGFRSQSPAEMNARLLLKVTAPGVLTETQWPRFVADLQNLTGIKMRAKIPQFEEVYQAGVLIQQPLSKNPRSISYFDFETMISPGIVLFPGREALLIPIRDRFADELFGGVDSQRSFLPAREALLRIEKVYFRKAVGTRKFAKGMPIVFYVSGRIQEVIGYARITSTAVISATDARLHYSRQGVLSEKELGALTDTEGKVHAFTFDSFSWFGRRVSFAKLKDLGCVGGANLVTAQVLAYDKFLALLEVAF